MEKCNIKAFKGDIDDPAGFLGSLAAVTPRGERVLPDQTMARLLAAQAEGARELTRRGNPAVGACLSSLKAAASEMEIQVDVEAHRKRLDREARAVWMEEELGPSVSRRLTPTQRARLSQLPEAIRAELVRQLRARDSAAWRPGTFLRVCDRAMAAAGQAGSRPHSDPQFKTLARRIRRLVEEIRTTCADLGLPAEVLILPVRGPNEGGSSHRVQEGGLRVPSPETLASLRASLLGASPHGLARVWRVAQERVRAWEPHLPPAIFAILGVPLLEPA